MRAGQSSRLLRALRHGAGAVGFALALDDAPARAQLLELTEDGFTITLGLTVGIGGAATGNTDFGAGLDSGQGTDEQVNWGEGYLLPRVDLGYDTGSAGSFYGAAAMVATGTWGQDAGAIANRNEADVGLEQLYGGWKSGSLFESLGPDAIDISGGVQDYQVGDGFLIWDGNFDARGDMAYWLAPRRAFRNSGILRLTTEPVQAQAFYLKADHDNDDSQLAGLNIEHASEELGTLGAMFFRIFESNENAFIRRDMGVLDLRALKVPMPFLPELTLSGEYVQETGGDKFDIDAYAWYAGATYDFAALLPWAPTLTYRYSFFSGDDNLDDDDVRSFDPLFYEGEAWGTWTQGEITGNYLLANSNQKTHMVQLALTPWPAEEEGGYPPLSFGLLYFRFDLDEPNYFGTQVSDTHFADELNLYADWTISELVYIGALAGIAWPGEAARDAFGDDDPYQLVEALLVLTY